jgi:hypothetical protein
MSETMDFKPKAKAEDPEAARARSRVRNFDPLKPPTDKPQSYYDDIKKKFAEERDLRLGFRPEGKPSRSRSERRSPTRSKCSASAAASRPC